MHHSLSNTSPALSSSDTEYHYTTSEIRSNSLGNLLQPNRRNTVESLDIASNIGAWGEGECRGTSCHNRQYGEFLDDGHVVY